MPGDARAFSRLHVCGLSRTSFVPTFRGPGNKVGTRKPSIHAGVPVFPVFPVKNARGEGGALHGRRNVQRLAAAGEVIQSGCGTCARAHRSRCGPGAVVSRVLPGCLPYGSWRARTLAVQELCPRALSEDRTGVGGCKSPGLQCLDRALRQIFACASFGGGGCHGCACGPSASRAHRACPLLCGHAPNLRNAAPKCAPVCPRNVSYCPGP